MIKRFPTLTPEDITEIMAHPQELLRIGFLRALNMVVPCLRHDLSDVILKCVDPDDDNTDAVYQLHRAMQQNSEFAAAVLEVRTAEEFLPAREFVKLIAFLASKDQFDLVNFAGKGMKALVRSLEQTQKTRTNVIVDNQSLTDKLFSRLDGPGKKTFKEIEMISIEAHSKKKGYNHSPYLVYIAASCCSQSTKVVPMLLGPG